VVVSAAGDAAAQRQDTLAEAVAGQLARLRRPGLAGPSWSRVITEKRATFACTPGLAARPTPPGLAGLFLAGDYTAGDYPATLESAVRSGRRRRRRAFLSPDPLFMQPVTCRWHLDERLRTVAPSTKAIYWNQHEPRSQP
jgi:hypothetical protein